MTAPIFSLDNLSTPTKPCSPTSDSPTLPKHLLPTLLEPNISVGERIVRYKNITTQYPNMSYLTRLQLIANFMGVLGNKKLPNNGLRELFDKDFLQCCLKNMFLKEIAKLTHIKVASLYALRRKYDRAWAKTVMQSSPFLLYRKTITKNPFMSIEERLQLLAEYVLTYSFRYGDLSREVADLLFDKHFFERCVQKFSLIEIKKRSGIRSCFLRSFYYKYIVLPTLKRYEQHIATHPNIIFWDRIAEIANAVAKMRCKLSARIVSRLLNRGFFVYAIHLISFDKLSKRTHIDVQLLYALDIRYGGLANSVHRIKSITECANIPFQFKKAIIYMAEHGDMPFYEKVEQVRQMVDAMKSKQLPPRVIHLLVSRAFVMEGVRRMGICAFARHIHVGVTTLCRVRKDYGIAS